LVNAHVGGQLDCSDATLNAPAERESHGHVVQPATLLADGLRVERDCNLHDGFVATGELRLRGAHVGGELRCSGAELTQPGFNQVSLYLERVSAIALFLPDKTAPEGVVDLTDARVSRLEDLWRPNPGWRFAIPLRTAHFRFRL
jgi:hypothetical protein